MNLAKWNGLMWADVGGGIPGTVSALAVYDDDGEGPHPPKLIAAGSFNSVGGLPVSNIAAWDGQGWSPLGTGITGSAYSLAVIDQDDAGPLPPKLSVAGSITSAGGQPCVGVALWDGTAWTSLLDPAVTSLSARTVCAWDDDGPGPDGTALYVAGRMTVSGNNATRVAKWSGTSWQTVGGDIGTGLVYQIAGLDPDGPGSIPTSLFVCGTYPLGSTNSSVLRLVGATWQATPGTLDTVTSLAVFDSDGPGPLAPHLCAAGVPDYELFEPGFYSWSAGALVAGGPRFSAPAWTLCTFDEDGPGPAPERLFAGGSFQRIENLHAPAVARWNGTDWSRLDSPWAPGVGGGITDQVWAVASVPQAVGPDALFAGGPFELAGGTTVEHVARWDGSSWAPLPQLVATSVSSISAFDSDGSGPAAAQPCLVGSFSMPGGGTASFARWDGSAWQFAFGGPGPVSRAVSLDPDGPGPDHDSVFVVGDFEYWNGQPISDVARWNGASWSAIGPGTNGTVGAIAAFDDGTGVALYIGGRFALAGSTPAKNIAKWTGTSWAPLGGGIQSGIDRGVKALAVFDDDGSGPHQAELYAAGEFRTSQGAPGNYIAKWNGSSWSALGSGLNSVAYDLCVLDVDGTGPALFVGGEFTSAGGAPARRLARWNGSSWSEVHQGLDGSAAPAVAAYSLAPWDPDGAGPRSPLLAIGGWFRTAGAICSTNIAAWGCQTGPCYANCDASTSAPILNVNDFTCFLSRYAAGDPYANCDNSTAPPVLNVNDFTCFLNKFAAGCP